jgi:hypothetical protein
MDRKHVKAVYLAILHLLFTALLTATKFATVPLISKIVIVAYIIHQHTSHLQFVPALKVLSMMDSAFNVNHALVLNAKHVRMPYHVKFV